MDSNTCAYPATHWKPEFGSLLINELVFNKYIPKHLIKVCPYESHGHVLLKTD